MRPHERPPRVWPILLATLIGTAILVTLGIWQVQRLQWKEGLLAQLAANAMAEPVGLQEAAALAGQGRDPEFVRVKFTASYKHDAWKKMIATYQGGQGWTIITPAVTAESSTKRRPLERAIACANVVLPVPGGPHKMTETALGARPVSSLARLTRGDPARNRCR